MDSCPLHPGWVAGQCSACARALAVVGHDVRWAVPPPVVPAIGRVAAAPDRPDDLVLLGSLRATVARHPRALDAVRDRLAEVTARAADRQARGLSREADELCRERDVLAEIVVLVAHDQSVRRAGAAGQSR